MRDRIFHSLNIRCFLATLTYLGFLGNFAPGQPKSMSVDVEHSTIVIHVFKSGLFSFAGDNHEIRAPISGGSVDAAEKTVELKVNAAKLTVLDPALSPEKRAQVQQKMLGPDVLDSTRFPEIHFRSTKAEQVKSDEWLVQGELTLHGQTRPVTVRVARAGVHYRGKASLKQTSFGIAPVAVAGGTIKVKDELKVDFDIMVH
jgi:polyisoprenoid-binding protein YceI